MTVLQKSIKRKLPRPIERGEWIVELNSVGITFRARRARTRFMISWDAAWHKAMEIAAEELRQERKTKRRAA